MTVAFSVAHRKIPLQTTEQTPYAVLFSWT